MNWIKLIIAALVLVGCSTGDTSVKRPERINKYVMEVEELLQVIDSDSVKVIDLRKPEQYEDSHIPGSVNIWRSELSNDSFPYNGMMGKQAHVEQVLTSKGISTNDFLVFYDDRSSCEAARLWWILDFYGYDKMAILNGGIAAWLSVSTLTPEKPNYITSGFRLPGIKTQDNIAILREVANLQPERNVTILDTRSRDEYYGTVQKNGASNNGRIPGSVHMDWMEAMNQSDHKFKTKEELTTLYSGLGLREDDEIVTYCHSGVRSAHTYFVLTELLGYENVKNFDGSWVEWTYHQLPVERDTIIN